MWTWAQSVVLCGCGPGVWLCGCGPGMRLCGRGPGVSAALCGPGPRRGPGVRLCGRGTTGNPGNRMEAASADTNTGKVLAVT